jgi:GTP-binding protein YchF
MKLGIIGLPRSGKTTVFEALTKSNSVTTSKGESRIGTIQVPDRRLDALSEMYQPQKTIYAQVEYLLPGTKLVKKEHVHDQNRWTGTRDCDALVHVIRNHSGVGLGEKSPLKDFMDVEQELILADLVVVEKRLERIELDHKRGKKMNVHEYSLLNQCRQNLENEIPLRKIADLAYARDLKGFAFLSAKPMLVLFNNNDDDDCIPDTGDLTDREDCLVIRGKLEQELAQMPDDEIEEFLKEFDIRESATDRVVRKSYNLLGLISFFTIGKDEVRAWTIKRGTQALDAAEVVHSDMKKGFIRAEVLAFEDLKEAGSYTAARKKGTVRLEGKAYEVNDGDIVDIRFNV